MHELVESPKAKFFIFGFVFFIFFFFNSNRTTFYLFFFFLIPIDETKHKMDVDILFAHVMICRSARVVEASTIVDYHLVSLGRPVNSVAASKNCLGNTHAGCNE